MNLGRATVTLEKCANKPRPGQLKDKKMFQIQSVHQVHDRHDNVSLHKLLAPSLKKLLPDLWKTDETQTLATRFPQSRSRSDKAAVKSLCIP